jgi:RNA polymerase sigma factor (sigma-70 family)
MPVFANDRELLDAFRRGDRDALATVYFHYVDDIAAIVRHGFSVPATGARVRGVSDEQTQRDVVQEVFARAFAPRARDAYDGLRPYGPYLRRIARNLMIDRARAEDHTMALDDDVEIAVEPEPAEDAEWIALRRETAAYVAGLPAQLQRLVELRFERELSQEDAARELGVSRRRVRTLEARIQRGLRKLIRRMQKDRPVPALVRTESR